MGDAAEMAGVVTWETAPVKPILREGEIHVWLSKTGPESDAQSLQGTLSTDEIDRAERSHFKRDRDRFVLARGALRMLLGR